MHEFGFWDTKFDVSGPGLGSDGPEGLLKNSDVCAVRERRCRKAEVINIREGNPLREVNVWRGDIDNKKERRDGRALWGAHLDWGEDSRRPLEEQAARALG